MRCKCGNAIEFAKGDVYYEYKGDDGKVLNKTASRHMSANRVRCPECCNNFCVSCGAEPYHIGKNCASHLKDKNAKKCRFCGANIKNG